MLNGDKGTSGRYQTEQRRSRRGCAAADLVSIVGSDGSGGYGVQAAARCRRPAVAADSGGGSDSSGGSTGGIAAGWQRWSSDGGAATSSGEAIIDGCGNSGANPACSGGTDLFALIVVGAAGAAARVASGDSGADQRVTGWQRNAIQRTDPGCSVGPASEQVSRLKIGKAWRG
ncbi:hypothetical protein Scep_016828 [Stephania cephalantha]|uniref:Uncharacterized protein n=1 Tax=Stephania cephalantha TaxID=152367 RepID=A0AAP0NV30_9MAGN